MDPIDKFLKLYSYKFPKGYPDMNDKQDILLLESILKEEFSIILEATNITDVLHETFFALAFESLMQGKKYSIPKNIKELEQQLIDFQNSKFSSEIKQGVTKDTMLDRLLNKQTTKQYFTDPDNKQTSDFSSILIDDAQDAIESAEGTIKAIKSSYPEGKIESIKRVASDENVGVADNVAIVDGEPILISLKKGKGQFGSLSIEELLDLMYGFRFGEKTGLLTSIDQNAVNDTLQGYIIDINNQIDDLSDKKTDTFKGELAMAMSKDGKIGKKVQEDISTPSKWKASELKAKGNETTDIWFSRGNPMKALYGRLYELPSIKKGNRNVEKNHQERKKKFINPAIDKFLKSKGDIVKDNIAKLVSFLLRQDNEALKDKDYLYVAQRGNKILKIPSRDKIFDKAQDLEVELGPMKKGKKGQELSDYSRDIIVKGEGKELARIPLLFRHSAGQFRDLLAQKGPPPTFSDGFTEYFGAKGDKIEVTA